MVLGVGVEPTRPCGHQPLKLACLPFHHPSMRGKKDGKKLMLHFHFGKGKNGGLSPQFEPQTEKMPQNQTRSDQSSSFKSM